MRTNDEVPEDVKNAKHGNVNQVVCGRVCGESDNTEAVMIKWDHKIASGVPFAMFVELVFRCEPERVSNAAHVKGRQAMTKNIIYIAYSNLWPVSSLYGINERIGLEGLELMRE